jgi:hypothetical protein
MDDAINILKEPRFKEQRDLLFQNCQPRITVFIFVQDIHGLPVQLRCNYDTVFLFSGMTDRLPFNMILNQRGVGGMVTWEQYQR